MIDVIRSGLEELYVKRKSERRKYAWALVQFYLFCKANEYGSLANMIKMFAKTVADDLTIAEYKLLFNEKVGISDEEKTLIGMGKLGMDKLKKRIDEILKSDVSVGKLKEAGLALLYYAVQNKDLKWTYEYRDKIVEMLKRMGYNDDLFYWKMTGDIMYLRGKYEKLKIPMWWFAWQWKKKE